MGEDHAGPADNRWLPDGKTRNGREVKQGIAGENGAFAPAPRRMSLDAVIVGSGPNGLAAGITLARNGCSVRILEAADRVGGGMRSAELTRSGFVHDVCSAIHPLGVASPFFQSVPLQEFGLEWIHPEIPVAHPLDDGRVALVHRSLHDTAEGLGPDSNAYRRLLAPLVQRVDWILPEVLGPLRWPRHPWLMARFGLSAMQSAVGLARHRFRDHLAQGMFAGMSAHSVLPLEQRPTAAVGLMFCMTAHTRGWPLPRGGTQSLADAMAAYLQSLGGTIETGRHVESLADIPPAKVVLFDTSPRDLCRIAGDILPARYRRALAAISLRPRGLQDRLGAGRTHPLEACGLCQSRYRSCRRHFGRSGGGRTIRLVPCRPRNSHLYW